MSGADARQSPAASEIEARMQALGVALPAAAAPVANYLATSRQGSMLWVSGQLPLVDGHLVAQGRLGETVTLEAGVEAARACLLNLLAQAASALGSLDRIAGIVRLGGFIAASADFTRHAEVMNGASDLAVGILGERGRHARSTVGVASLPLGAPVEIEAVFAVAGA